LPGTLPRADEVSVDWRALLFALGVSLGTGVALGIAPAFKTMRVNLQELMNEAGRGSSGVRHRVERLFAAAEVALALVLLAGAGLMVRSLEALWRVDQGFNPSHAITFTLSMPATRATTADETRARLRQFDDVMRRVPGVDAVSVTLGSRPMIHDSSLPFWIEGRPKPANDNEMAQAMFYLVEAGFRDAMGMTLERGRFINEHDDEHAPVVIDIDDVLARTYFPYEDPVGKRVYLEQFGVEAEIVGVVGHVKQWGPAGEARSAIQSQFYYPFMQMPPQLMAGVANGVAVVLRTTGDPAAVMGPVRRSVEQLDPRMVVYAVATLEGVVSNSLGARRVSMILLSVSAALALLLACVGIYGVVSYVVGQRTHEIGVRMAMGADRRAILRLVLGFGFRMALAGSVVGVVAAVALTRVMVNQLFGVSAHDPLTFGVVTAFRTRRLLRPRTASDARRSDSRSSSRVGLPLPYLNPAVTACTLRECRDARGERAPVLLRPGRTCRATRAVDKRFHVVRMNSKLRSSFCGFAAAAAHMHLETEVTCSATQSELIHHPVGGALQLVRLPHRRNRFRELGEWGFAYRQGGDGIRRRQIGDKPLQCTGSSRRDGSLHACDQCVRLALPHADRFVVVGHRRQPFVDECHPPPLYHGRHAVRRRHAHEVRPSGVFGRADDTRGEPHAHRFVQRSPDAAIRQMILLPRVYGASAIPEQPACLRRTHGCSGDAR
jgi:hypothetical protein